MNSPRFVLRSTSEEMTMNMAACISLLCGGGTAIGLSGTLGAGKSVFSRGLARALGIQGSLPSPSYPIILEYPRQPGPGLCHMDWYRLGSVYELEETGALEYLDSPDWICLIEWWNKFAEALPIRSLKVEMLITGAEERLLQIHSDDAHILDLLASQLRPEWIVP